MAKRTTLLPAAGASSRMMGRDKLLEDVEGQPLLRSMAERALESSDRVIVTVPDIEHARVNALNGLDLCLVAVPDASEGMSASLRRGALAAGDTTALMVLPPDMPDILSSDIKLVWSTFDALKPPAILRCTSASGALGHPVVFGAAYLKTFDTLTGDTGAAAILQEHKEAVQLLALEGERACRDLDHPQDWENWRTASQTAE